MPDRIWFISGASSGLGRHIAREVAMAGNTVIGTARKKVDLPGIDEIVPGKTFGVQLDVNDHDQIQKAIQNVLQVHGRIDVLVNNAGYGLLGSVEETSLPEARAQMETNFFGALALTQAVLPSMRERRSGHLLQISSIAGIVGAPGLGLYDASKHALEGMSEALHHELAPLGIRVTIVEPGPFRTEWAGASMRYVSSKLEDYRGTAGKMTENLQNLSGKQPGDPARAGKALLSIVDADEAPLRLPLGARAIEAISAKLTRVQEEFSLWGDLAKSADFPT